MSKELEIIHALQNGDAQTVKQAGEALIKLRHRFVSHVARKLSNDKHEVDDLTQEGLIGLLHAAKLFDPTRSVKFQTYATWWIRQAMLSAMQRNRLIKIPKKWILRKSQLGQLERMGQRTKMTKEKTMFLLDMNQEELAFLDQLPGAALVLDAPVGEHGAGASYLNTFVSDETHVDVVDTLLFQEQCQSLQEALKTRSVRDQEIFHTWLESDLNNKEIGHAHGLSKERVRQILDLITNKTRELLPT